MADRTDVGEMRPRSLLWWRRAAGLMAAGAGTVHLALASEHLRVSYLGGLFIAGGLACVFVAVRLWQGPTRMSVWVLGATATGAMAAGLIASRVVGLPGAFGLPGVQEDEWGVLENASLLFELGFLALAFLLVGELRALKASTADHQDRLATRPAGDQIGGGSPTAGGLSRRRVLAALVPVAGTAATARLLGGPSLGFTTPPGACSRYAGHGGGAPAGGRGVQGTEGGRSRAGLQGRQRRSPRQWLRSVRGAA